MTHIILIGMPGCGKSTVGKALARRMGLPFIDTDAAIEERIGGRIRDYFDTHGEDAFRDIEEQTIAALATQPVSVIATGGGAVLRPANRQNLHDIGTVIYLRASPEYLHRRLRYDRKRPLLQVADPLAKLRTLYAERDPLYRQTAHHTIDTHGLSLGLGVNRILMQIELGTPAPATPPKTPRPS